MNLYTLSLRCSRGRVASFAWGPLLSFLSPGRALTVFHILSSAHSPSPDFLHQNALASVGVQAFGEHISRTLGDAMRKLTSLLPNPWRVRLLVLAVHGGPPPSMLILGRADPRLLPGGPARSLDGSVVWT